MNYPPSYCKTKIEIQGSEKPENQQTEQNLVTQPDKNTLAVELEILSPTPLDDESLLVSQKALSSKRCMNTEQRLAAYTSLFIVRNRQYAKPIEAVSFISKKSIPFQSRTPA